MSILRIVEEAAKGSYARSASDDFLLSGLRMGLRVGIIMRKYLLASLDGSQCRFSLFRGEKNGIATKEQSAQRIALFTVSQ